MRYILIVLAASLVGLAAMTSNADEWQNPDDQYKDAYKDYLDASCPIGPDKISYFVYFSRDRDRIKDHAFLSSDRFVGAQIMYPWRQLEKSKGKYDFSKIRADLDYLNAHDKRLFIQLQDVSFSKTYKPVPHYLMKPAYEGGMVPAMAEGKTIGWIAKC